MTGRPREDRFPVVAGARVVHNGKPGAISSLGAKGKVLVHFDGESRQREVLLRNLRRERKERTSA